jgi:electron transport complex protein RnfG
MSEKKESAVRMIIALVIFSAVACVALAFVYVGTKSAIDQQAAVALAKAQQEVFPDCTFTAVKDIKSGNPAVGFDNQWQAMGKDGKLQGVLIQAHSAGFQDNLVVLIGVKTDGTLAGIRVTYDADTPGLGLNAASPTYYVNETKWTSKHPGTPYTKEEGGPTTFYGQFAGMKTSADFRVMKDGGDVVALTAATISSRAVTLIVNEAVKQGSAWLQGGAK